jgi:hypothetical protein
MKELRIGFGCKSIIFPSNFEAAEMSELELRDVRFSF